MGIRAFKQGDKVKSGNMMKWRVVAQGFTVACAVLGGALFGLKPHDRPKSYDEKFHRDIESTLTKDKEI